MKFILCFLALSLLINVSSYSQSNSQELVFGKKNKIYMNGHKLKSSQVADLFMKDYEAHEYFSKYRTHRFYQSFFGITSFVTPLRMVSNLLSGNGPFDYLGPTGLYSLGALGGWSVMKNKAKEKGEEAVRIYNYNLKNGPKKRLPGL